MTDFKNSQTSNNKTDNKKQKANKIQISKNKISNKLILKYLEFKKIKNLGFIWFLTFRIWNLFSPTHYSSTVWDNYMKAFY